MENNIEILEVSGWVGALKGMRFPLNSDHKSDTDRNSFVLQTPIIGDEDLKLAIKLVALGPSHRKFLRMLHIQLRVSLSRLFWIEWDTYKVSTVSNSRSTMHTLTKRYLLKSDFAIKDWDSKDDENLCVLNSYISLYNQTKDKKFWRDLIDRLPQSFIQERVVDINYETALNMISTRSNHKLDEWKEVCKVLLSLPYMKEFSENYK